MSRGRVCVIGAGPNGLIAAAMLAKAGREVIVLERRATPGGLAAPVEFHPGWSSGGLHHDTTLLRPHVVDRLDLARHGLTARAHAPDRVVLGDGVTPLVLPGDPARVAGALHVLSDRDAAAWDRWRDFLGRVRPCLIDFLDRPPVNLVDIASAGAGDLLRRALRVRGLGRDDMLELIRVPALSARDWLDEWFETPHLKAALAIEALSGNWLGPRSPGSAANLILRDALRGPGYTGGGQTVAAACARAAAAQGATVRTGACVEAIVLRDGRAAAVVLEGGETIEADAVAASCDPKRTFAMLPPGAVSHRLARRIAHYRMRGTTAQVLLALNAPPRFAAYPDLTVTHAVVAESLDAVERAFDPVKYRILPVRPVIEIHVPSVESPDLAPPGGAVVSCLVHFVPLDLEGGWSQDARDRLGDRVLTLLEEHIPGVRAACVGGLVMDPSEIEERYGVTGGHILHGEQALDQMLVRPAPECSGYATPVPGLWICGGGVHPGGGLTGGPGFLAAQAMLRGRI